MSPLGHPVYRNALAAFLGAPGLPERLNAFLRLVRERGVVEPPSDQSSLIMS